MGPQNGHPKCGKTKAEIAKKRHFLKKKMRFFFTKKDPHGPIYFETRLLSRRRGARLFFRPKPNSLYLFFVFPRGTSPHPSVQMARGKLFFRNPQKTFLAENRLKLERRARARALAKTVTRFPGNKDSRSLWCVFEITFGPQTAQGQAGAIYFFAKFCEILQNRARNFPKKKLLLYWF